MKKKCPAIIFNDTDFIYPKGLRVTDPDELKIKLMSGEWNTGPVDAAKGLVFFKPEPKKKHLSHMNLTELLAEAKEKKIVVDPEWHKRDLVKAIRDKG